MTLIAAHIAKVNDNGDINCIDLDAINTIADHRLSCVSSGLTGVDLFWHPVPGHEFVEAGHFVVCDAREDPSQPGFGIDLDLSRFSAAPSARLSHLPFECDRAFPSQC